jgi:hypothetical protein
MSLFYIFIASSLHVLVESSICEEHQNRFNISQLETVHEALSQWNSILPFILERESDEVANNKGNRHREFNYLGPIGPTCASEWVSYGTGDEEKRVCGGLQLYRHQHNKAMTIEGRTESKSKNCIVYSVGSNNQYLFEEDVFKRTKCFIEIFDCTVNTFTPPAYIKSRIRTHKVCLGSKTEVIEGRQFMNWTSLNALTGLSTNPDFLKMDIEGYEYPVLHSIIDSGENFPLQIAMELHISHIGSKRRHMYPAELIAFMNYLRVFGGYYLVNRRDGCSMCTEIVVAMLDCQQQKKNALSKNSMNELKELMNYNALFADSVQKYLRTRESV